MTHSPLPVPSVDCEHLAQQDGTQLDLSIVGVRVEEGEELLDLSRIERRD